MDRTRFVICAAGKQSRWNNHLGVPKHMAPVYGEPLIHRTIRQLKERGAEDMVLLAFDESFGAHGVDITQPTWPSILERTGIGISYGAWARDGRTVVVFGDVFFTEHGADVLFSCLPSELEVLWYGRSGPGVKGYPWKELFGLSFYPQAQERLVEHIELVREEREKVSAVCNAGGWLIYRSLNGLGMMAAEPVTAQNFIEIDDDTTDFDDPEHYDAFAQRLKA